MPIALILTLLVTGSASLAIESSNAGDILYPVKAEIHERLGAFIEADASATAAESENNDWNAAAASEADAYIEANANFEADTEVSADASVRSLVELNW